MRPVPVSEQRGAPPRPSRSVRRTGYVLAIAINLVLLWLVNVRPGWRALPVLTEDFVRVVWLVTVSLVVGVAVNLLYLAADPRWLKHLGEAVTAAIACAVLALLWSEFPFAFAPRWAGWETPVRILIGIAAVATAIAVVANLASLVRVALGAGPPDER